MFDPIQYQPRGQVIGGRRDDVAQTIDCLLSLTKGMIGQGAQNLYECNIGREERLVLIVNPHRDICPPQKGLRRRVRL